VTAPAPAASNGTSSTDGSALDRRRAKAQSAKDTAERAQARVADLDAKLRANEAHVERQQTALRRARDETARLKQELKAAAKQLAALTGARKKARAAAAKARDKAANADAKYDQVVLAEIVRREKDRADAAAAAGGRTTAPGKALEPATDRAPVPAEPADGAGA
jgi:chromosome segregation ATPase